eukprot:9688945-Alexandrium_andersonii.AAC.1
MPLRESGRPLKLGRQGAVGHRLRRSGLGDAREAVGRARRCARRSVQEGRALLGGGRRPHPQPRGGRGGLLHQGAAPMPDPVPGGGREEAPLG